VKPDFPFPCSGDEATGERVLAALRHVIDPELAMGIVDLGLVYGIEAREKHVGVRMTMTSAACPVADVIVEDVKIELTRALGPARSVVVDLVWDPPWTPERMTPRARRALGE